MKSLRSRGVTKQAVRKSLVGYAFVLPWVIGLLVFQAYPIVASLYYSFTRYNILQPAAWIGLQNFVTMFTKEPLVARATGNTLYFVSISVPLGLMLSLGLAMLMNQKVGGIGVYRTIFFLPTLMPPVAGALLWLLILEPNGLMNALLRALGIPQLGWFRSPVWSKPALILMSMWGVGNTALIFLGGLKEIPVSLYESASIDGAHAVQKFRHVTLPLLTPVIFFNLVMAIIGSFQVFAAAFVVGGIGAGGSAAGAGGGGPLNSMLMYMVLLYRHAFRYFHMGYASAMAVTLALVILILTVILVKTSGGWVFYESAERS